MFNIDFDGQVALITGGCKGIGGGISKMFAKAGAKLILVGRKEESEVKEFLKEIENIGSHKPSYIKCDMCDEDAVRKMAKQACSIYNQLDLVINNAGGGDQWNQCVNGHLIGTDVLIECCSEELKKSKVGGKIVIIGSNCYLYGGHGKQSAAYIATKAGESYLTLLYARRYAPYGIRVNCILPGPVMTEATKNFREGGEEAIRAYYEPQLPLHKMGEPCDIAGVSLFLCSDLSRYMTGQILNVDGGRFPCAA